MRIVLDTNVLVSGLLNPHGPPGRIVDLVVEGHLELLIDDRIFHEYADVLARPRLGLPSRDVADVLEFIEFSAPRVASLPLEMELPDERDRMFVEVSRAGGADAIVTGNLRHFPRVREAISPAALVGRLAIG